jgi:cell shape-determining protein MreC
MKKLLVIPIMAVYFLLMLVLFPIQLILVVLNRSFEWLEDFISDVSGYYEDYLMKPSQTIYRYALRIMKSDKTIKWIEEASEKLKQGKPID